MINKRGLSYLFTLYIILNFKPDMFSLMFWKLCHFLFWWTKKQSRIINFKIFYKKFIRHYYYYYYVNLFIKYVKRNQLFLQIENKNDSLNKLSLFYKHSIRYIN